MYQLKFILQQHTPIIHFQHDQEGATLRATEVKPKLDRYLLKILGNGGYDAGVKSAKAKGWLIGEHRALDYKLQLDPNYNKVVPIESYHRNAPMYFANLGTGSQKHFKIKENTKAKITSFQKDLLEWIEQYIVQFFFENNFGTRQSKGYGSFEVIDLNDKQVAQEPVNYKFKFEIKSIDWQELLKQLNWFYKSLRTGINEISRQNYFDAQDERASKQIQTISRFYFKPLIFLYAKHLNKQWDKKTIKQTYFSSPFIYRKPSSKERERFGDGRIEELSFLKQIEKYPTNDILSFSENKRSDSFFLDFKDVFGLSSAEEWRAYDKTIVKENADNNSTPLSFQEKAAQSSDLVERHHSPIQFKPVKRSGKFIIYVSYVELPDEYKGQKFIIYDNKSKTNPKLCLQIPNTFTFQGFFSFVFNKANFDIIKHVERGFQLEEEFLVLKNIFSQIQIA